MSTPSAAKQTAGGSEPQNGLSVDKFLSTLDWATDTHPATAQDEGSDRAPACIACRKPTNSSSEDVTESVDHVEGYLVFKVAREHRIAFSPVGTSQSASWRFRAVFSVFDARLRLAVQTSESDHLRCLSLDTKKILEVPDVRTCRTVPRLEISMPFVALAFEADCNHVPQTRTKGDGSMNARIRLIALKDAVVELMDGLPGSYPAVASENDAIKDADFKSAYEIRCEELRTSINWTENQMTDVFTHFENRCAQMTMPPAFPYRSPQSEVEGLSVDQGNHHLLVDAFLVHDVTRVAAVRQAEAWVRMAVKPRDGADDKMLPKEEIEARRKHAEMPKPS